MNITKLVTTLNRLRDSKHLPGASISEALFFFTVDVLRKVQGVLYSQSWILTVLVNYKYVKRSIFLDTVRFKSLILYDYILYSFGDKGFARGTSFSQVEALAKGLGEVFERTPFRFSVDKNDCIVDSVKGLREKKVLFFDIFSLSQATAQQKEKDVRMSYTEDSVFEWVICSSFVSGEDIYVPKQLVYWGHVPHVTEKILREQNTNGLASSDSREGAITAGLFECLQRHFFFNAWYFPDRNLVVEVDLESLCKYHKDIQGIVDEVVENMLCLRVFRIKHEMDNDFQLYFSVLENKITGGVYLGCSGSVDSYGSIRRSVQEALSIYTFSNRILFNGEDIKDVENLEKNNFKYGVLGNSRVLWWGHYVDEVGARTFKEFTGTAQETYVYKKSNESAVLEKTVNMFGDFALFTKQSFSFVSSSIYSARVILPNSYTLTLCENFAVPVLNGVYPHNVQAHPFP